MADWMKSLISLLVLILSLSMAGCGRVELVRQSITPVPQECEGVLYVATNEPVQVGIEGSDKVMQLDVGGYYLVHANDLAAMIEMIKDGTDAKNPEP